MKKICIVFLFVFFFKMPSTKAQEKVKENIDSMIQVGECAELIESLTIQFNEDKKSEFLYTPLLHCLFSLNKKNEIHTTIIGYSKATKNLNSFVEYDKLAYNILYEKMPFPFENKDIYLNPNQILEISSRWKDLGLYEIAKNICLQSASFINSKNYYISQLKDIAIKEKNFEDLFPILLDEMVQNEETKKEDEALILQYFKDEKNVNFAKKYLKTILKKTENENLFKIWMWIYLQQNQWVEALSEAQKLDKETNKEGLNMLVLADFAAKKNDYEKAIETYDVCLKEFPKSGYIDEINMEKFHLLSIKTMNHLSNKELVDGREMFNSIFGKSNNFLNSNYLFYYCDFLAKDMRQIDTAILFLEKNIDLNNFKSTQLSRVKLLLGDYYGMINDRWNATLLYAQVEKNNREDLYGEEARYRNARLSYFYGDFEWAKNQLDVLKESTSELIANDALELSILIIENTPKDSNWTSLKTFAKADWFFWRGISDTAIEILHTLNDTLLVDDGLHDDIYFKLGKIALFQKDTTKAREYFTKITQDFKDDILADDALWQLIQLDIAQHKKVEANEKMKIFMLNYSNSTLITEVRKYYKNNI